MSPVDPDIFRIHPRLQRRRITYFTLVYVIATSGVALLLHAFMKDGLMVLEMAMLPVFAVLFYQLTFAFVTAVLGWMVLVREKSDPLRIGKTLPADEEDSVPLASTAITIPIYNEDATRVFEGLRIMFRSLEKTGHLSHFDFFILSDSDDANRWVEEEVAWLELCKQLNAFGRIFYRKRRQAINRKSGNIGDFCRRWGRRYRYMIVLDADSLMGGAALVRMVRLMERNPIVGIMQTLPKLIHADTLFGRVFQFSTRLYGPIFAAGMDYWQGRDGSFWGHNAIVRLQPFIEHCGLPELPGKEPLGGRILSHDYVEAALMRKAGFQVCLAAEIEESYEEGPPTLIDHLKRDRRWCQGNLQHMFLLSAKGWSGVHRLAFYHGILNYLVSPIWFLFLIMGTFYAITAAQFPEAFRPQPHYLILLGVVVCFLFLPKVAVNLRALLDPEQSARFGGRAKLFVSAVLEIPFFTLLAPVLMVAHSRFVVLTVLGQGVRWATQSRRAVDEVDWREAIITFYKVSLFGLGWGLSAFYLNPGYFVWLSPVVIGLTLSIPFHILSGGARLGALTRQMGLFLTNEELNAPWVIKQLDENLGKAYRRQVPHETLRKHYGLLQVIIDPYTNALHVSLLRLRTRPVPESQEFFEEMRALLLEKGPDALEPKDIVSLMYHPESLLWLNDHVWSSPAAQIAPWWRLAMRQYNLLTPEPITPLYR
ncbi:MAG: glucans biosynthesis glucosyltransferase MdoH [Verrucomicrobiota bacterium]|nr:glucans biosynthesis glucosyltransferase MdoH [Verrucomicrobiota bacterium]